MGEHVFGNVLEKLDKAFPDPIDIGILYREFGQDIIDRCIRSRIIDIPTAEMNKHHDIIDPSIPCVLSAYGFLLLNQIRMKKTLEMLNDSIYKFDKSSEYSSRRIEESIKKFDEASKKSSKEITDLTWALVILTGVLSLIACSELIPAIISALSNIIR